MRDSIRSKESWQRVKTNYVLIDYENVQVQSLALLKGEQFSVRVFLGPKNTKLPVELVVAMQELGCRAEYIVLETPGSNALDFHIAYYLGALAAADPAGFFHIISKDTGFDPLIRHLRGRKIFVARSVSIEEMPCFKVAASVATPPPQESKAIPKAAPASTEELLKLAVAGLIKYKENKPGKVETLRSTINAMCGKDLSATKIDEVYNALLQRGYVKINGTKVSYALPSVASVS
ncbi:PIN domain-containing protein [Candidatus Electronema sp. PJ]|uniref:PIN domain-containing protein n=1 Tax=Candidatus Electronema sp. PJ TaxID=3401572 RepID=UPI003AA95291